MNPIPTPRKPSSTQVELFRVGCTYTRSEIHKRYGGQKQGGISTPAKLPIILLFTGAKRGAKYGYSDGWESNGRFKVTGQGQVGNMQFTRGNVAIRDHAKNRKDLHVFECIARRKVRYVGQMVYASHNLDTKRDRNGSPRTVIVFHLVPNRRLALVGAIGPRYMRELERFFRRKGKVLDGWDFGLDNELLEILRRQLRQNGSFHLYYYLSQKQKGSGFVEHLANIRRIWTGKAPRPSPDRSLTPTSWLSKKPIYRTWFLVDELFRDDSRLDYAELRDFRDNKAKKRDALRHSFAYVVDQVKPFRMEPPPRAKSRKDAETIVAQEGAEYRAETRFRTRNWKLIDTKKRNSDRSCEVCGMRFEKMYGAIGRDYIIAHHKIPIGSRVRSSKTTLDDIALVCANCHDMLHRRKPTPLGIKELRDRLKSHLAHAK
jgi:hypothetical protein